MLLQAPTKMQRLDIWSYMVKGKLARVLSFLMLLWDVSLIASQY